MEWYVRSTKFVYIADEIKTKNKQRHPKDTTLVCTDANVNCLKKINGTYFIQGEKENRQEERHEWGTCIFILLTLSVKE